MNSLVFPGSNDWIKMHTARPIPNESSSEVPIPNMSPISSNHLAPRKFALTVDVSQAQKACNNLPYTLQQENILATSEQQIPLLDVLEVTQITLEGAHQMIAVGPYYGPLFFASQCLIKTLIIHRHPDGERAASQHVVAFHARYDLACFPACLFGVEVCTEDAL
jgi:hypothetical protein